MSAPTRQQGNGRIARYAWGRDYHDILGERLKQLTTQLNTFAPGYSHRAYVDTGPVMEKAWAQQAGLGWIGKHSNLVSAQFGSWLLLGEILTTLPSSPMRPAQISAAVAHSVSKPVRPAPFTEPYVVDAGRCISYRPLNCAAANRPAGRPPPNIGSRIFGCDDCLDICPYNHQASPTTEPGFNPSG